MYCSECGEEPEFKLTQCAECEQQLCEACFGWAHYNVGCDTCRDCCPLRHESEDE